VEIVLTRARADSGNDRYPEGELHAALVFVRTEDRGEAQQTALRELESAGWRDVAIHQIGTVDAAAVASKDEAIRTAYQAASSEGVAIVVYREAEEETSQGA